MNTPRLALALCVAALAAGALPAQPLGYHRAPGGVAWANRSDIIDVAGTNRSTGVVTGGFAVSDDILATAWEQVVDGATPAQGTMVSLWDGGGSIPAYTNLMVTARGTLVRFPKVVADASGGFWIVSQVQVDNTTNSAATLVVQHLQKTGTETWTARFANGGLALMTTPAFFSEFAPFANADGCYVAWCGGSTSAGDAAYLRVQHIDRVSGLLEFGAEGQTLVASGALATSLAWTDHPLAGPVLAWCRQSTDPLLKVIERATPVVNLNTGVTDATDARWVNLLTAPDAGGESFVYVASCRRQPRLRKLAIDADGIVTNLWDPAGVAVVPSIGYDSPLHVVPTAQPGEVIATWYVLGNSATARAQRFTASGVPLWEATGRVLLDSSQPEPAIVADLAGGFFHLDDVGAGGIRVQRFDGDGAAAWSGAGRQADLTASTTPTLVGGAVLGDSVVVVMQWQRGNPPTARYGVTPVKLAAATGLMPQSRLVNLSTRAPVGTGDNVAIAGFVVDGDTGAKDLVVRAAGPALGGDPFNLAGVLANPVLALHQNGGGQLHTADDWGQESNLAALIAAMTDVGAFPFASGSADAAFLRNFDRGGYTAVVSGAQATTGIALLEAYDTDTAETSTNILHDPATGLRQPRLANISTRAVAGTGDNVVIVGFVVQGPGTAVLLARCVGATLGKTPFNIGGVLANPSFDLHDHAGAVIFSHDDAGETNPQNALSLQLATQTAGAFTLNDAKDAAAVLVLNPGLYTIAARGVGGTSGVCLTELYDYPRTNVIP